MVTDNGAIIAQGGWLTGRTRQARALCVGGPFGRLVRRASELLSAVEPMTGFLGLTKLSMRFGQLPASRGARFDLDEPRQYFHCLRRAPVGQ